MLHTGIKGNRELTVTQELTAQAMGSGELPVFATPAVIALAEETAWRSVAPELEPGQGTVGTELHVEHISATPVGMKVRCETDLQRSTEESCHSPSWSTMKQGRLPEAHTAALLWTTRSF